MSKQPKFTLGPWVGFNDQRDLVAIMPAGRDGDICTFAIPPSNADGNLMIAAPDLYEALAEFLKTGWEPNTLTGGPKRMAAEAKAQAALCKAAGKQP